VIDTEQRYFNILYPLIREMFYPPGKKWLHHHGLAETHDYPAQAHHGRIPSGRHCRRCADTPKLGAILQADLRRASSPSQGSGFRTSTRTLLVESVRQEQDYEETTVWGKSPPRYAVSGFRDLERKEQAVQPLPELWRAFHRATMSSERRNPPAKPISY
jgi:hypothetical protein